MIAILDWGIGGMGFFKLLRARHPEAPVIYFSDTGAQPYGKLPTSALLRRVHQVAATLRELGAHRLVIACNAASTVLPRLGVPGTSGVLSTAVGTIEVAGIIDHAVRLVRRTDPRGVQSVGVIGGRRTIRSGIYQRALGGGRRIVIQRIAQPLSARVEAGELASPRLERELAEILRPLAKVDALVLACTHYAALAARFTAHLPHARLIDPAPALADWVAARWLRPTAPTPVPTVASRPRVANLFLTTGDPRAMRTAAFRAFNVRIGRIVAVPFAS
ncbi:MAG TPA: aspartate/glutamate racemase family protein [Polyangia bacterium]|nr:aspartate/glutamate racemase family protein [Polyangia bacterium]